MANRIKNSILIQEAEALPSLNIIRKRLWDLKCPLKLKNFFWRAVSGAILVVDKLVIKRVKVDPRCQTCGLDGESINHVLFTCTAAR